MNTLLQAPAPEKTRSELILLLLAAAFVLVNFVALAIVRQGVAADYWLRFGVWCFCAAAGHLLLKRYLPARDPLFFPLAMFLSGWGLVIIERLLPFFAERQMHWLVVSVAAMLAVALLPRPLRWLRDYRYVLLFIGLALLVSTILLGQNPSGQAGAPQLWLGIGSVYFQPSEALKIILVAFLASYLGEQYPVMRSAMQPGRDFWFSPHILGPILLMWGLCVVVLIWQRDLGTAMLFFIVFLTLLYVATGNLLIPAGGLVLVAIAAVVGYNLFSVVELRIDIWLDPWPEARGRAYQIVQSLMAFAAGGVFGQGIGQGSPLYIPVVHSDFAFAALAEEWGLLGVVGLLVSIVVMIMRGLRTALLQQGPSFYNLLAVGLSTLLAVQALLIAGGVLKLVPLTGITMPYISYGGSSLLMSFVLVGLLLRLSAGER